MKIVTGRTGSPHVTSEQHRQILEGTIGQGSFILTSGDNLEPELVSNNQLKIRSGMLCHHGCVSAVELGTYDTVQLDNGSQGKKRIDVIVGRYNKNNSTDIEACDWVVVKGTETAGTPTAPNIMTGNMQEGDLVDDCAVFEIYYDGINVTEVKKLLSVAKNMSEMEAEITELNSKIEKLDPEEFPEVMNTYGLSVRHLKSGIKHTMRISGNPNGQITTHAFTLPEGVRPNNYFSVDFRVGNIWCLLSIDPNGNAYIKADTPLSANMYLIVWAEYI